MEEYEVNLGDYIRVLWQEKWVVVITFVTAVAIAAIYAFRTPNVFQAEAVVTLLPSQAVLQFFPQAAYKEDAQPTTPQRNLVPDVSIIVEWTKDYSLLSKALAKAAEKELSPDWFASHFRVQKQGNFVNIRLEAPMETSRLKTLLQGLIIALQARGNEKVKKAIESQLSIFVAQRQEIQQRLLAAQEEVAKMRNELEKQREQILVRVSEVMNEAKERGLSLGSQTTPEGYQLMKELDLLYARLEVVETEIDKLSRLGVYALSVISSNYTNLQDQLRTLEAKITEMQLLLSQPSSPVMVIRGPWASLQPVGPQQKLTLAVAGVLGLFLGVLLAFVVHYFKENPLAPSTTKEKKPPQTGS